MDFRKVALLLPYNEKLEILFQNRIRVLNQYVTEYSFFGGKIEKGETVEQALSREIMEELEIDVSTLRNLRFFKRFNLEDKALDIGLESNVFLCEMPDEVKSLKCNEGKSVIVQLSEAINLNISPSTKQMLEEVQDYLLKRQ